jgi:hemerythrin-like domain-containing protein
MEPVTEVLGREHRVVLGVLDRFERALEEHRFEDLRDPLSFFEERLVLHRRKEEEVLFPALAPHFPPGMGPVACMIEEHRDERVHLDRLAEALDLNDAAAVVSHGHAVLQHLRNHIWKEDNILFPMAERLLDRAARERVLAGFAGIGCCCPECGEAARAPASSA